MNKKKKDLLYAFLIRWWAIGAVYFLIGWGTQLGRQSTIIDLVFFLGLAVGLVNTFLVNPALKMLFNMGWHKSYGSSTFMERFVCRLKDVGLGLLSVSLVMVIYQIINSGAINFFDYPSNKIFLPGEPILFGLFYALLMQLILFLFSLPGKRKH